MKTLLFGKKDPRNAKPHWLRRGHQNVGRKPKTSGGNPHAVDVPFDSADSAVLLTPEWDKGNDDPAVIRSSLGLDATKRHPPSE